MEIIEFRKPYSLGDLIRIIAQEIRDNDYKPTYRHSYPNTEFNIYTKGYVETATPCLICFLEHSPEINEDDDEIYPDFVVSGNLELFYNGQQFEDVIYNALSQKLQLSTDDFITALNHYRIHDSFVDLL